jgi:hypothetical protein
MCLGETIIDIGPQGVQRHLSLVHRDTPGNLGTIQPAGTTNPHPFSTRLHRTKDCLFQCPPIGKPTLNLVGHIPCHKISIELWLWDLPNVQLYPLTNQGFELGSQFIDTLSTATNKNAGTSSMDSHGYIICLAVNLDRGHASLGIHRLNQLTELYIFLQILHVVFIGIPLGIPIPDYTQPETCGVYLMSH